MTKNRVVTGPQHCAPKLGSAWHGTAERREHAFMESLPSSRTQASFDEAPRQSRMQSLLTSQHTSLPVQNVSK